jgi:sulfite reductase alpha subunit-like flavoprotein
VKISVDEQQIGQLDQSSLLAFPEDGLTLLELFCFWINLMEPPSRYFMQVLSSFVEDDLHRQKLEEFCSKTVDGKSEYYRYCIRERRTVIEALFDFQPTRITLPLAYLIQLCGRQRPREFSISSAMSKHPGQAHVTMAVTEYTTKFKREKKGICSYWLSRQMSEQNDPIPVWLKKGSFTFPSAIETPLIMVGPGTGLAAFRSFI